MTKGTVVLKTGQKFETVFEDNREFSVKSLTDETIQAFPTPKRHKGDFRSRIKHRLHRGRSMKIIQPGVLPSEKIYNSICPNCSCVFEFEEAEAVVDKDFVEMPIVKIDCPTCSQPVHEPWKRSA